MKRKIYKTIVRRSETSTGKAGGGVRMTTSLGLSPKEQYFTSVKLIFDKLSEQTPVAQGENLEVLSKWSYNSLKWHLRKWDNTLIFSFERSLGVERKEKFQVSIYGFDVNPEKLEY